MKKIMLALSFLSVGGVVRAAELTAEQLQARRQPRAAAQAFPAGLLAAAQKKVAAVQQRVAARRARAEEEAAARRARAQEEAAARRARAEEEHSQLLEEFSQLLEETPQFQRKQRKQQKKQRKQRQKQIGAAALIAATTTYVTRRAYQNRKKRLVKEYNLGNLNNLEDKLWLATILARYGISWRLRALISNNPAAVAKLSDPFLNALAELYYGKKPSQVQMSQFMQRFFPGRK